MLKRIQKIFHREPKEDTPSVFEEIEDLFDSLNDDILSVTLGQDLVQFGELVCKKISEIRQEIKSECGFILPQARVIDNIGLQENEFNICIRGKVFHNGYIVPNEKGVNEEFYETLKTLIYEHMGELFTNEMTEKYIGQVQKNNGWLIWNLTYKLSMTDIRTIMLEIINKGKSINNINYIFEQIGEMILSDGKWNNCCSSKYNPEDIAKTIAKRL